MDSMTMQEFIDNNRRELMGCIRLMCPSEQNFDNDNIELWIVNDEGLYNWARDMGVDV